MKNIHVLPTEKSSRLCKETHTGLHLTESMISKVPAFINQHIYITNDEEIKEGDWVLFENSNVVRKAVDSTFTSGVNNIRIHSDKKVFKIILTTDQDLIKDGVQAIDDDFLEWFVQNPSCEEVERKKCETLAVCDCKTIGGDYKIIIPKEETKQVISVRLENSLKQFNLTLEEALKIEQSKLKQIGFGTRSIIELQNLKPKQETQSYICPKTNQNCDDEMCDSASNCNIDNPLITDSKEISFEEISNQFCQIAKDYKDEFNDDKETKIVKTHSDNQEIMPKQETLVRDYSNRSCQTCNLFNSNNDGEGACELELENECASYSNDETLEDFWISCLDDESDSVLYKQETLEEALRKFSPLKFKGEMPYNKTDMIEFAKSQQEQNKNKYSEEEVLEFLNKSCDYIYDSSKIGTDKKLMPNLLRGWFEQFKKK